MINKETSYTINNKIILIFKGDSLFINSEKQTLSGEERFELLDILNKELSTKDNKKPLKIDVQSTAKTPCTVSNNPNNGLPLFCEDCSLYKYSPKFNISTMCKSGGMYRRSNDKVFNVTTIEDDFSLFNVSVDNRVYLVEYSFNQKDGDYSVFINGTFACKVKKVLDPSCGEYITKDGIDLAWCACNESPENAWKEASLTIALEYLSK